MAPPFRQAEFDIVYGEGISREGCILDLGVEEGVVGKSGSWYTYGDERLGQGRESAKQYLCDKQELRSEIEGKIKNQLGLGGSNNDSKKTEQPTKAR